MSYWWIMTVLQNFVLKKSQHFVFCNIFKKFFSYSILWAQPWSSLVKTCHCPCKNMPRNSSFKPKIKGEQKDRVCINCEKVPKCKHYKNGFEKRKLKIHGYMRDFPFWEIHLHAKKQRGNNSKQVWCVRVKLGEVGWSRVSAGHRTGGAAHWRGAEH